MTIEQFAHRARRAAAQKLKRQARAEARREGLRESPQNYASMPFGLLWREFTSLPLDPQSSLNQDYWPQWARREAEPCLGLYSEALGFRYVRDRRVPPASLRGGTKARTQKALAMTAGA